MAVRKKGIVINFAIRLQWIRQGPLIRFSAVGPSSFVTFPVSPLLSIYHSVGSDLIKLSEVGNSTERKINPHAGFHKINALQARDEK